MEELDDLRAGSTLLASDLAAEGRAAGDRGVLFLAADRPPRGWELLGPEGLYLIDGAKLADTVRSDPTVAKVEALTVAQLDGAVGAAVAAVERGELMPKMPSAG